METRKTLIEQVAASACTVYQGMEVTMIIWRQLLGEELRAQRTSQGRSLRDISAHANVALGYLSELERGHKEVSSELLASICSALNVGVSEILHNVANTAQHIETSVAPILCLWIYRISD